jgi:hypothetical protein
VRSHGQKGKAQILTFRNLVLLGKDTSGRENDLDLVDPRRV